MNATTVQEGPTVAEGITTIALRPLRSREPCNDCGISRSDDPGRHGRAFQFVHPRYDALDEIDGRPLLSQGSIEGITTLRRERPRRMKRLVPRHTWQLVEPYGLAPKDGEPADAPRRMSR